MEADLRRVSLRLLLLWGLIVTGLPSPVAAQAQKPATPATKAPAAGQNVLRDRIVALVDEDPILESEIDRAIALGLQQPNPGESESDFRRRVLDALVSDRLRLHQIDRFGFVQVPVEEVQKNVAEIRNRFASEEEFQRVLQQVGLSPRALRQLVVRQLMVLTFVEERLGPRVFVSLEDINDYYRQVLAPEMQRQGQPVPPIDQVREDIRLVLKEQKLTREIVTWTKELRNAADVNLYFDRSNQPLPPVVERIERIEKRAAEKNPPRGSNKGSGRPRP